MNLISIELECRSFKERQLITFGKGRTLINGHNPIGDTSSGVGKSTIPLAIAFALGFCDLPSTELKNWETGKLYVHLKLQKGTDIIDIIRSPKLQLIVNGVPCQGTSTAHEQELTNLLGVNISIVKALTYRPQRAFGMFLSMTDANKKEFLTKVLDLEEVEKGLELIELDLKSVQSEIEITEGKISQMESMYASQEYPDPDQVKILTSQLQALEQDVAANLAASSAETQKIDQEIQQYEAEKNKIFKLRSEKQQAENSISNIQSTAVKIKEEINKLKENLCWTCNRHWSDERVASLIVEKTGQLRDLAVSLKKARDIIRSVDEIPDNDSLTLFDNKIKELWAARSNISGSLTQKTHQISTVKHQLASYNSLLANKERLEASISSLKDDLNEKKVKHHILRHSANLMGRQGFLGSIFDEILRDIQTKSNAIIEHIPNVEDIRLMISSTSVTKSGKLNKNIVTEAVKDGRKTKIKTLSGGQQASLELASDLAVSEVIRNRSGISFDWIILDEAMDGLDVNTKMQTLDVIKQVCEGQVIIIDHSTEIKESFNQVINLSYNGKETHVVD